MPHRVLLHHSPHGRPAPAVVRAFAEESGSPLAEMRSPDDIAARASRGHPAALILDASPPAAEALALCSRLKGEAYTSVVPVIAYVDPEAGSDGVAAALEAGADEVLAGDFTGREAALRLRIALRRAERDVGVHPTTLLPGTIRIEREIAERVASDEKFAVCYADLDHFKEFNDRYGYNHGDRVILLLSRVLREVVRGHSSQAFVGHIGGDDFIFIVPLADVPVCCDAVIEVFEELIPLQYSADDRERGYFVGKDRRGEAYHVPLMTLSIGVVTNERRGFVHTAQISELATEMKAYAKTLEGSVWVVDRRHGRSETEMDLGAVASAGEAS